MFCTQVTWDHDASGLLPRIAFFKYLGYESLDWIEYDLVRVKSDLQKQQTQGSLDYAHQTVTEDLSDYSGRVLLQRSESRKLKHKESAHQVAVTFDPSDPTACPMPMTRALSDPTTTQPLYSELKPGGAGKAVENKDEHLRLWLRRKLVGEVQLPTAEFAEGLNEVIPLNVLRMFSASELQELISGGICFHADCGY